MLVHYAIARPAIRATGYRAARPRAIGHLATGEARAGNYRHLRRHVAVARSLEFGGTSAWESAGPAPVRGPPRLESESAGRPPHEGEQSSARLRRPAARLDPCRWLPG